MFILVFLTSFLFLSFVNFLFYKFFQVYDFFNQLEIIILIFSLFVTVRCIIKDLKGRGRRRWIKSGYM